MNTQRAPFLLFLLGMAAALCGAQVTGRAATFTVKNLNDSGAGSLRQAISDSRLTANDDTIVFDTSVTGTIQLQGRLPDLTAPEGFLPSGSLTLQGPGAHLLTVRRDAGGDYGIFKVPTSSAAISGLTITNGYGRVSDGGSAPESGGGIESSGDLTVTRCTISNCRGFFGGGIYSLGTLTLRHSTISGNSANLAGGGISCGRATIENCTISGNEADGGPTRVAAGGGIDVDHTVTMNSVTVTNNRARTGAGGISNSFSTLTLNNCIVAGNFTTENQALNDYDGRAASLDHTMLGGDAKLGPLQDNGGPTFTHLPRRESAVLDNGSTGLSDDQRGSARPLGTADDMGAVEQAFVPQEALVVTTLADEDNGNSDPVRGTGTSLREAMDFANRDGVDSAITFSLTVFVAPRKTIVLGGAQLPPILNATTLTITAPAAGVVVDANHLSRVFQNNSGATTTLTGLTLLNGTTSANGGAVVNGGTLRVVGCTLSGHRAAEGGALHNQLGGSLTVENSTLHDNAATLAFGKGGGISNGGALEVRNSTFSGNNAPFAAAIYNAGTPGRSVALDSATIAFNTATDCGGIINDSGTPVVLTNTLLAGNANSGGSADRSQLAGGFSGSHNLVSIGEGSGGLSHGVNGNLVGTASAPIDARLGALAADGGATQTQALLFDSPAYNAGATSLAADQRGIARPQNVADDIGAFEFNGFVPSLVVTTLADEDNGTSDVRFGIGTSLREAIANANRDGTVSAITFSETVFAAPRKTLALGAELPAIVADGALSITAPAAGVEISGGNARRIFVVESGANVGLAGLRISNGSAASAGGAIVNRGALTITASALSGHRAPDAGAIFNEPGATLTLVRSTLRDNAATGSFGKGGAVFNAGALVVQNSTFGANAAYFGGSIYNSSTPGRSVSLDSATLAFNTATDSGGIINDSATPIVLTNTLIAANTNAGGGANRSQLAGGFSGAFNLVSVADGSGGLSAANGNRLGSAGAPLDARLDPAGLGENGGPTPTFAFLSGSPILNTGQTALGTDQRGTARPLQGRDDIGAVEQAFTPMNNTLLVSTLADEDDGITDPAFGAGTSLREALAFAESNADASTITFPPELFAGGTPGVIQLSEALPTITRATTIVGPGAKLLTVRRNATANFRIFTIETADAVPVTISGLTIANGRALSRGGGIYNFLSALSLVDCAIVGNETDPGPIGLGGGLNNRGGKIRLVGCTFSANRADVGGAIYNAEFTENDVQLASMALQNCTFSGNSVIAFGGSALATEDGPVLISNCSIAGNICEAGSGSVRQNAGSVTIDNSIVAGNTGGDLSGSFTSGGHNLIGTGSVLAFNKVGDRAGISDSGLGALADNGGQTQTRAPLENSPARDAGDTALVLDQIGNARPRGAGDDIGALEAEPPAGSEFVVSTFADSASASDGVLSLREAITAASARSAASVTAYSVITFDPAIFAQRRTIALGSALPGIAGNMSLAGPAAGVVVQAGSGLANGFTVSSGRVRVSQFWIIDAAGEGIFNQGDLTVERCTFSGNTASGLLNAGTLAVINSTVALNPRGIETKTAGATAIFSSTISGNSATGIAASAGTTRVSGSIVAGNAANVSGTLASNTNNLLGTLAEAGLQSANGQPVLGENGGPTPTIAILRGTAAVDTGDAGTTTDQRNSARPSGAAPDKGAVEFDFAVSFVVTVATDENNNTSDPTFGAGTSLREAITDANRNGAALDAITFSPTVFATRQTITLGGALPAIASDLTITAPAPGVIITGSASGGLLRVNSGTVELTGLTMSVGSSIGLYHAGGTLTARNCLFTNAGSNQIFPIYNDGAASLLNLQNCTVIGGTNSTAITNADGALVVQNCTITGNRFGLSKFGGTISLANSIVAGNSGGDVAVALALDANNLKNMSAAAAGLDPAGLQNNGGQSDTVALLSTSPALHAGGNSHVPSGLATDQRGPGFPRIRGSSVDIGAYEFLTNSAPTPSTDTLARFADRSVSVPEATLLANDTDPENDTPLTLVSVSAPASGQGTVTRANGFVFYDPAPGFSSGDTFTYQVRDNLGATATGTVTVNISAANPPVNATQIALEPAAGGGTQARVTFTALPGRSYRVQSTDDLGAQPILWQTRSTATADAQGRFQIIDPPPLPPQRFYRAVCP